MAAIKQWMFPVAILVAWLATASYTVVRLSSASDAWEKRRAAEAMQPEAAPAPDVAQGAPASETAEPAHAAAPIVTQPGSTKVAQAAPAAAPESESTESPPRLGRRLLARPARSAAKSLP
jgi:uncharacterized membrane protein